MRIRTYAGALMLAVAAVAAVPGSASAMVVVPGGGWDHVWTAAGVSVSVEEHGDIVMLCDTSANGHAARADIYLASGGTPRYSLIAEGNGNCIEVAASNGGPYNLPENQNITIYYNGTGLESEGYAAAVWSNDH